jgi:hypothetical protein
MQVTGLSWWAAATTIPVRRGSSVRISAMRLPVRAWASVSVRPCSRQAEIDM